MKSYAFAEKLGPIVRVRLEIVSMVGVLLRAPQLAPPSSKRVNESNGAATVPFIANLCVLRGLFAILREFFIVKNLREF